MLEQVFKLSENKTNVRTEIVAGITTFLTMAYIIFVNPAILAEAKMPLGAVFSATCVAAAIGCFLMAFLANYPIALAPGMVISSSSKGGRLNLPPNGISVIGTASSNPASVSLRRSTEAANGVA